MSSGDENGWVWDCVQTLRMLDGQLNPVSDEDLVTAIVDAYRRAQRPEWAQVNIENLLAEHRELEGDYELLEEAWAQTHRALRRALAQRDHARDLAVRLEQELAQLEEAHR